jgi:hypothetical protein
MKTLSTSFRLNDLTYTLLKRNDVVALYGIGGTYTDKILHWEVTKIYIRRDQFGVRESLATNENFGRGYSYCFNDIETALQYFDELTDKLNNPKHRCRGHKSITGVGQIVEVIPDYQLVKSMYSCY